MYGLARVRIASPDLSGEEILVASPYYERHIFIKQLQQQAALRWRTFRPFLGRGPIFPENLPLKYMILGNTRDNSGNPVQQPGDIGIQSPAFTGIFIGDPINAYIPAPLLVYLGSPMDQYPVSKYNYYPNLYPYAIASPDKDESTPGVFRVIKRPEILAFQFPELPPFRGMMNFSLGSRAKIFPVMEIIPKKVSVETVNMRDGSRSHLSINFPKAMISWLDFVLKGQDAFTGLTGVLTQIDTTKSVVVDGPRAEILTTTEEGITSELADGYFVGMYLDWHSGKGAVLQDNFKDFTFGFQILPIAPIFQQVVALKRIMSVIRVFWGGYYMIEILPERTTFYFFKDGYTVPSDPTIPTRIFLPSENPIYKLASKYGGIYSLFFALKYLRPVVNGDPFPPNVFIQPIDNMSFPWGSTGIQPAGRYDLYIIMHIRGHVCIFSYSNFLNAITTGEKVEPLFVFNPLEYIYRNFGEEEARRWWQQNGYAIARADAPPKMWFFNVAADVFIPYFEYLDTAISTKPSFIIPQNVPLPTFQNYTHFHYTKVAPSGIFMKGTVNPPTLNVPEIPMVLSLSEPVSPYLNFPLPSAIVYGDEVNPVYFSIDDPSGVVLTKGVYRAYAPSSPDPNFVGMRLYAIPSPHPDYPFLVEHVVISDDVKKYIVGEVSGTTPQGMLRKEDLLMTSVVFRTSVRDALTEQTYWGEISGFKPTPRERAAGAPLSPTIDGEAGPFIDYLDLSNPKQIVLKPSPILPRPPVFVGADIFRMPIVAESLLSPPSITFISPPPRGSPVDTGVEEITVTLVDNMGGNTASVRVVVDESLYGQIIGVQPVETITEGFPPYLSFPQLPGIPPPSKLLYRRMVIECGYVMELPNGVIEGVLYPVFDGIVSGVSVTGARETSSGRQIELTIKGSDIYTRLRWVPATGKDPILDNWTPGAFAMWALAAAGLSPLRAKGITGLPLGAPLTWWLGNEQVIGRNLLGGYGFPIQNIPESPRAEIGTGSSLGDALERYAGMSGCEIISIPSPSIILPIIIYRDYLNFIWRQYLMSNEYTQFATSVEEYISETVFQEIGGRGNYWLGVPWRSTLGIIPAGYYSPIPSWTLFIGPGDYTTGSLATVRQGEILYQVVVPEAPFSQGVIEFQLDESIWNLPTQVTVEGQDIFGIPFYYLWADINREVNPFAWYYGGFRIPRYILNPQLMTVKQAKLAALRAYFSGRLFPPKTVRVGLSVGLPFLYPRQTVVLVTSDRLVGSPFAGRQLWVIRSVTHTWSAGDTPKTVLDLVVPHWFPIGIPTQ